MLSLFQVPGGRSLKETTVTVFDLRWPIGSGVTESGVKQFNKRVKGTDQFWNESGVEAILALRAQWLSQDDRWNRYWTTRPAHQQAA